MSVLRAALKLSISLLSAALSLSTSVLRLVLSASISAHNAALNQLNSDSALRNMSMSSALTSDIAMSLLMTK